MREIELVRRLLSIRRQVRMISACTPENAAQEAVRLRNLARDGRFEMPRWKYAPAPPSVVVMLARIRHSLDAKSLVGGMLVRRLEELSLEAAISAQAGRPELSGLAHARFGGGKAELPKECALWIHLRTRRAAANWTTTGRGGLSLMSLLHQLLVKHRISFSIEPLPNLSAMAATGHDKIFVRKDDVLSKKQAERIAVHEVLGHVVPRWNARNLHPIYQLGTQGGEDEQEGYALCIEENHGHLDNSRKRELATRHLAIGHMLSGATFADVTKTLVTDVGCETDAAVQIACRVFRGSNGVQPGVGRERVYLTHWQKVRERLATFPEAASYYQSGQVSWDERKALANLPIVGATEPD